jgi:uncharacterized protein YecE (DUF72 family)
MRQFTQLDRMTGSIRIGIGGWVFPPWRGTFFPDGLPQAEELAYAAGQVTAIEINATFYGPQRPESFRRWRDETPAGFVFSVKGPRGATHRRELDEARGAIDRFFAGGVGELGPKLGPFLWQFPPTRRFEPDWFGGFLGHLPPTLGGRRVRHVVELRHPSFDAPEPVALLRKHNIARALVDAEDRPLFADLTADFVYARLERMEESEPLGYAAPALDRWAARARTWLAGGAPDDLASAGPAAPAQPRDCFLYCINGAKIRAPAAALALIERLGR